MLARVPLAGHTVMADKGFAGEEFLVASFGGRLLRPDRKDEGRRHGSLGAVRQWIESVFWTCKGQLGLERHGARTLPGLGARIGLRLLALAAGLWHNHQIGYRSHGRESAECISRVRCVPVPGRGGARHRDLFGPYIARWASDEEEVVEKIGRCCRRRVGAELHSQATA